MGKKRKRYEEGGRKMDGLKDYNVEEGVEVAKERKMGKFDG
ncbi:hypothetical protein [Staphylococcus saprophyticus]|nr:hypothetical protein [Staphylococcus saprophyticus]